MTVGDTAFQAIHWYLAVSLLGWVGYPILYRACARLMDRGVSLVRPAGLLLVVVPVWWTSETLSLPFRVETLVAAAGVVALAGMGLELACPGALPFIKHRWRLVGVLELMSLLAFVLYVAFRGFQPDIAYTEKPMDLAFLASATRTERLPVPDPWFAGLPANYYVFGYVQAASLAKLTGTSPEIAFNLALATVFALTTTSAFGIAADLARLWQPHAVGRRWWLGGAAAVVLLIGLGNLYTPWQLLRNPSTTLHASWWQGVGWRASRVIVDSGFPWDGEPRPTINEFPAFSFVLGDLHPHLLALPTLLLGLGVALSLFLDPANRWGWFLGGLVAGSAYAANSWDMPTIALFTLAALAVSTASIRSATKALAAAAFVLVAIIVSFPFSHRYVPSFGAQPELILEPFASLPLVGWLTRTLGIVVWSRSSVGELLLVHGLFLFLGWFLLAFLVERLPEPLRPSPAVSVAVIGSVGALAILGDFPALSLFGLPAAALLWIAWAGGLPAAERFTALLLGLCWALITGVEIFYLQDVFGDRMNTVFKISFQAWALQSVVLGAALPALIHRLGASRRAVRLGLGGVAGLLVLGSATYLPISAYHWTGGFSTWRGIDGLSYLEATAPDEAAGIAWLRAHASPGTIVIEAPGCSYGVTGGIPHNRVSMATGIPTVLGWGGHEYQWRRGSAAQLTGLDARREEVAAIYQEADPALLSAILERYRASFVYIGTLERRGLGPQCGTLSTPDPQRLEHSLEALGWRQYFAEGEVAIYGPPGETAP